MINIIESKLDFEKIRHKRTHIQIVSKDENKKLGGLTRPYAIQTGRVIKVLIENEEQLEVGIGLLKSLLSKSPEDKIYLDYSDYKLEFCPYSEFKFLLTDIIPKAIYENFSIDDRTRTFKKDVIDVNLELVLTGGDFL